MYRHKPPDTAGFWKGPWETLSSRLSYKAHHDSIEVNILLHCSISGKLFNLGKHEIMRLAKIDLPNPLDLGDESD